MSLPRDPSTDVTGRTPATSRPRLSSAPGEVREVIADLLGGPVSLEVPAAGGFTPSVASTVADSRGRRLFIKAAPAESPPGDAVATGVELADVAGDLAPALVGAAEVAGWWVAAYEVVDGGAITSWRPEDLQPLLRMVDQLRDRLDPSPVTGTTPFAGDFVPLLGTWQALISGREVEPAHTVDVEHLRARPLPVDVPVHVLADLEARWLPALSTGTALHHGDLRRDNVLREPSGRLRVVDWTHLWSAPGWLDLARLIPDVASDGHDPERLLQTSSWAAAPPDDINVALAGWAGRAWREGLLPDDEGVPGLRAMQHRQALHTLRWLEARLEQRT